MKQMTIYAHKFAIKNLKIKTYRTIILAVVLYGCKTWSLTFREERRLRVFENKGLRRIFGPKRDEVTGEWRKLHNEELNDLYCSLNVIRVIKSRRMKWTGHVARTGDTGKSEGKRPSLRMLSTNVSLKLNLSLRYLMSQLFYG